MRVTSHTRTATPDSAQEETIEFYSYVQPILASGQTSSDLVNLTGYAQI